MKKVSFNLMNFFFINKFGSSTFFVDLSSVELKIVSELLNY